MYSTHCRAEVDRRGTMQSGTDGKLSGRVSKGNVKEDNIELKNCV